jgi:hypothetical protein
MSLYSKEYFTDLLEESLQGIRQARNNMSKDEFLAAVLRFTGDANVAIPLLEAASQVSIEQILERNPFEA